MTKFIDTFFSEKEANVIIFGVPLGKNSCAALESLRGVSRFVEPFDIDKKINLLENIRIADVGNLELKSFTEITDKTRKIIDNGKVPIILGGGHLLSLYSIQAFKDIKIIIFDAHTDLKNQYEDEKIREMNYNHSKIFDSKVNDATWLRRLSEKFDPKKIFLLGVRSCDEDELEFLKKSEIKYFTTNDVKNKINEIKSLLIEFTKDSNVYISVDIDVFDPSIAPSVDYPEPNGLLFNEFLDLLQSMDGKIKGIDVVCLNPIKFNQITEFLTVKVIFQILGLISKAGVG